MARKVRPPKAADHIDTKTGTLANWRSKRIGPPFSKIGRMIFYDLDALDAWVEAGRQSTGESP